MGTKTIVVILVVLAISLQGCFVSVNSDGNCGSSSKVKKSEESAVKTTINTINNLPSEESKIATLRALSDSPMSEDEHIALIKAIEGIQDVNDREELLIAAINARTASKSKKPVKNCNSN